jgi:hypothetical protein
MRSAFRAIRAFASPTFLLLLFFPVVGQAQTPPITRVDQIQRLFEDLAPTAAGAFTIHDFTFTRDAATFRIDQAVVWPLTEIDGRVVGIVWRGRGRMSYTPPAGVERLRLKQILEVESIDTAIVGMTIYFADSTFHEFRSRATPDPVDAPSTARGMVTRFRDHLRSETTKAWDPTFLEPFVNNRTSELFYALIERTGAPDLSFQIDPEEPEPVTLLVRRSGLGERARLELVTSTTRSGAPPLAPGTRRRQVTVSKYVMDISMPQQFDGGVRFSARADLNLQVPPTGYGQWIPFTLAEGLVVDSATWDGAPAQVFQIKETSLLWIRAPGPIAPDATPKFTAWYAGDQFERIGNWFFLRSVSGWYPQPLGGWSPAAYDVTYHAPLGHPVGSVGRMVDSSVTGRLVTTRYVHDGPIPHFSFNIGRFDAFDATIPGSPPITLLWSEAGHVGIGQNFRFPVIRNVRQVMTDEIGSAMKFFTTVYGPPSEPRFVVTEIPYSLGVAFPGLVHLSFGTFMAGGRPGSDQVFRAHEVGHQWWGVGVYPASYRDWWLAEGLAEFSGTWYMQTRLGSLERYLEAYRESRRELLTVRERMGPVSLGHRLGSRNGSDYALGVYHKGAWTMHMLRVLMLQLSTMNEDKFTNAMREFYTTYRGRPASTDDLRVIMEKHANADLRWFFDQWIHGTGIPTYRWAWRAEEAENGQHRVRIRVKQTQVPDTFQMYVPVTVELRDGRLLRTRVHVVGPLTEAELPLLPAEIKAVRFNELEGVLAEVTTESW